MIYRRLKYGRIFCFGFPEYCIRCIMFTCQGFVSTTALLKQSSFVQLIVKLVLLLCMGVKFGLSHSSKGAEKNVGR